VSITQPGLVLFIVARIIADPREGTSIAQRSWTSIENDRGCLGLQVKTVFLAALA
jgi:hypothetical protein